MVKFFKTIWILNHKKTPTIWQFDNSNKKKRTHDSDDDNLNNEQVQYVNWSRFLIIHSVIPERSAASLSPFAIAKGLKGLAGELKHIKKMRSGDILVECSRRGQSENLLKSTKLVDLPIMVSPHKTLNTCKGVIRYPDLADVSDEEMVDELRSQGVLDVKRLVIKRYGNEIRTNTFFVTFDSPTLPT